MALNSKRKGNRGEQEIVQIYNERGWEAYRVPFSGAGREKGDVGGVITELGALHIEVKRMQKPAIPAAIRQAEGDCPEGAIPAIHWRRNHEPWYVALPLEDFLDLIERARPEEGEGE